jgi:hypothetical protein
MSTFLILPPRECLEQAVRQFTTRYFPGLNYPPAFTEVMIESLVASNGGANNCILLYREELLGEDLHAELVDGFGAEPMDTVIEIGFGSDQRSAPVRMSRIAARLLHS